MVVGGCNNGGAGRVLVGLGVGRTKMRALGIKQGQRRNVRAQRCDVPEGGAANVTTLRSNVVT